MTKFDLLTGSAYVALAAAVGSGVAMGQESEKATFGLEEIVVTAQKRAESLQDVPIAISAFNESNLEAIKAVTIDDIVSRTPNFTLTRFNIAEPQYYIRGVGSSSDSAAADPTVAVFLDEVYVGRGSSASFEFFDLERVEVLRGPQGTLYGRNTSGGAINIITRKPSHDLEAKATATYGNYDAIEAAGMINAPLGDKVAARATVSYRSHDGYSRNIVTGEDLADEENISGRLQFLIEPSDSLKVLVSGDYSKDETSGNARVPFPVNDDSPVRDIVRGIYPEDMDIRQSYANPDTFQDREVWGLLGRVDYEAGYGTWTSITSYRETDVSWFEDVSLLPAPFPLTQDDDIADETSNQFTQEIRLSAPAEAEVQWLIGAYFFDESVDRNERFRFGFTFAPAIDGDVTFIQDVSSKSYAGFGQVTYPLSDALSVTAGLRYTYDKKDVRQVAINNLPGDPTPGFPLFPGQPYDVTAKDSWDDFTGRIGFEYKTADGQLIYALVSRGYKSGQFPSQANTLAAATTALAPEKVWNYEGGVKTDWLDNHLRVNASVFYVDYTDLQLFRLDESLRLETFNADAKIFGVEGEFVVVPAAGVEFGGNLAYLDTKVKTTSIGLYADNALPRSPKWQYNIYGSFSFDAPGGTVTARGDYSWTDDYFHEIQNSPVSLINSYGLLDARLTYALEEQGIDISVWGKNLTNKDYRSHVIEFLGVGFSLFGAPRTYGLTVSWKMN